MLWVWKGRVSILPTSCLQARMAALEKKAEDTKTFVAFLLRLRGSPGLGAPGHDTPGRGAPGLEIQDCTR